MANIVLDVQTVDGVPTTDTLIDNVQLTGIFGGLSNTIILCNGEANNINISNLILPRAYESVSSANPRFINATVVSGGGVNIDNIVFDCPTFTGTTFRWAPNLTGIHVGNYVANDVPILPVIKTFGTATLPSGDFNVIVQHGMGRTPIAGSISVTPSSSTAGASPIYARNITATTFMISGTSSPSADVTFNWQIDMGVS